MAWILWLAAPAVATVVASIASWLRNRPLPVPDTDGAMRAHSDYLDALTAPPRGAERGSRGA